MFVAYLRTFARMGLKSIPMAADTGPIGGDLSHEFIILAETGESQVYCHADLIETRMPPADLDFDGDLSPLIAAWTGHYAATDEKHDRGPLRARGAGGQAGVRARHRGRPYFLLRHQVLRADGLPRAGAGRQHDRRCRWAPTASGVSRLVGAIIEASHDEAGIVWPVPVAPFEVGLINLKAGDKDTDEACDDLYGKLARAGVSVLYDDTDERAGGKFATMDLIGLPFQLIVGPKGLKSGEVEVKERKSGERVSVSPEAAVKRLVELVGAQRVLA